SSLRRALMDAVSSANYSRQNVGDVAESLRTLQRDNDVFLSQLAAVVLEDVQGVEGRPRLHSITLYSAATHRRRNRTVTEGLVMQARIDDILELQSITLFSQANAEDLAELAGLMQKRHVDKGTVFFREGEAATQGLFILRTGQ